MTKNAKWAYWLAGALVVVVALVWHDHGPTASIGSSEALDARRDQLALQMSAVFDEEDQLVKSSSDFSEQLPNRLSVPKLLSNVRLPLDPEIEKNLANPVEQVPRTDSKSDSYETVNSSPQLITSGLAPLPEESLPKSYLTRLELEFDLNYLLTPIEVSLSIKKPPPESKLDDQSEYWVNVTINSGDSLSSIFKQLGLNPQTAIVLARQTGGASLSSLRVGPHLKILRSDREFLGLRYQTDRLTTLSVEQKDRRYNITRLQRKFDITEKALNGVIRSSLFESGLDEGISLDVLYSLSSIFQWKIDFSRDLRPGDTYSLIFEERSLDGNKFSSGPILAAEIVVNGKPYRAIRHVGQTGSVHYFTPDGESLEGLFLRSPMRISRITSTFSKNRFHPVLKTWRSHKGVDYGGAVGDPVMATADGVVTFAGTKGHYGRAIIIQHGKKYSTLYAHLSRFSKKIRVNRAVTQGQVIGYVGSSGLVTGPHLHYEFRVNGIHKNPLTVKLPRSFAIDREARPGFLKSARLWSQRLDRLTSS